MGDIETYIRLRNSGIALVENIPGAPDELRALGASASDAAELARLNQVYFGPPALAANNAKPVPQPFNNATAWAPLPSSSPTPQKSRKPSMPGTCESNSQEHPHTASPPSPPHD
ncbi:hypothetical protein [Corynebacterium hesseae]